jgi:hypothetical protein
MPSTRRRAFNEKRNHPSTYYLDKKLSIQHHRKNYIVNDFIQIEAFEKKLGWSTRFQIALSDLQMQAGMNK